MSKWVSMIAVISALKELFTAILRDLLWLVLVVDQGSFLTIIVIGEGQTSLRESLLLLGHPMVGIHESDTLSIRNEGESCLIAGDALIGEVLEDLLESRLLYTILLDAQVFPLKLKLAEEPADGLAFLGHSHLEKLAALFKDLNLLEVPCQVCQDTEAVRLSLQVLDEVAEAHLSVVVQLCFCYQIVTNTVNRNLLEYEPIKVRTSALIYRSLEVDLGRQIISRASEA